MVDLAKYTDPSMANRKAKHWEFTTDHEMLGPFTLDMGQT